MNNINLITLIFSKARSNLTKTKIIRYSLFILLLAFSISLIFILGVFHGVLKRPIAIFIEKMYYRWRVSNHPMYNTISSIDSLTNPDELIDIESASDLLALRDSLIHFLWGKEKISDLMPHSVIRDWTDARWSDVHEIQRINKITVKMEFDIESNIYHFMSQNPNGQIIIFHAGHEGDFIKYKSIIARLLREGYDVLAFCMPLVGINNQPVVKIRKIGHIKLVHHNIMNLLDCKEGHPIKYFIEPVISAINYIEENYRYTRVSMMGISGGGWTTTLCAAIDPRIKLSFSVSGTLPLHLFSRLVEFEQMDPDMYKKFSYLELYLMASYGEGRKHFQINNQYDPCCYYGINALTYKDVVERRMAKLGVGKYELIIDKNYEHSFSERTLDRILCELRAQ